MKNKAILCFTYEPELFFKHIRAELQTRGNCCKQIFTDGIVELTTTKKSLPFMNSKATEQGRVIDRVNFDNSKLEFILYEDDLVTCAYFELEALNEIAADINFPVEVLKALFQL